jgi:phosphate transport system ATP-binding protein
MTTAPNFKSEIVLSVENLNVYYGDFLAVENVTMEIPKNKVTAFIGPSGCGKSTFIRCLNRMNDLIVGARIQGKVIFENQDIYSEDIDATEIRSRIGMVFQKPNPFPKSIYQNIAFGLKINGFKGDMDQAVEKSLKQAALWDEVKDRLDSSAFTLSGGQQQRLCIARALAVEPDVLLMDEPASSLDPIATVAIEDLVRDLKETYSIVIVTHNMQQAARVSDETAFFMVGENRSGYLVEYNDTQKIFTNPDNEKTEEYITGRFS